MKAPEAGTGSVRSLMKSALSGAARAIGPMPEATRAPAEELIAI